MMSEIKKYWRFSLTIGEKNKAKLNWGYLSHRGPFEKQISEELLKEFHVELINADGLLVKEGIPKIISADHEDFEEFTVSSAVSFDDKSTEIIIYRNEKEVFRLPVPQEKPYIKLIEKQINKNTKELKWNYTSSSPNFTWFRAFFELDNGKRYPISDMIHLKLDNEKRHPPSEQTHEYAFKIDFNDLPGCKKGKVIVMISDGVWTAEDISGEFELPPKMPNVKILFPKNGQKIQTYDLIQLSGRAWDYQYQTPIDSEKLVWKLDGKEVGKGKIFVIYTTDIKLGTHTLSLDVVDNNGNSNSDEIEIEIFEAEYKKVERIEKKSK